MARARVNGVEIEYAEAGAGFPLVWCHEYAGSMESWLPQVRFFARRYRVITYNARGYAPSEVPTDPAAYSQDIAVEDLHQLLRHLGIGRAHVGGLSMGGATALHFGMRHPDMARALVVAAAGSGSDDPEQFRQGAAALAKRLEDVGAGALEDYSRGATRVQLMRKDPVGWQEFHDLLLAHSAMGSALTMRGVQAERPPLYAWEEDLKRLDLPTLVVVGDEDTGCLNPALFMKRTIPRCGLAVLPGSGHAVNLEEPDLFNRLVLDFLTAVEAATART